MPSRGNAGFFSRLSRNFLSNFASPPEKPGDYRVNLSWLLGSVILFSILSIIFTTFLYKVYDFDTGFHLAAGNIIFQTHSLPRVDPFSYLLEGQPWHLTAWGFDVLVYGIYNLMGFAGLSLAWALLGCCLFFVLLYFALRQPGYEKDNASRLIALCTILAGSMVLSLRWPVRPECLAFLCLAMFQGIYFRENLKNPFTWLCLLVIQAVWTNIHLTFVFSFLFVGTGFLTALLKRSRDTALLNGLFLIALFAASCMNPYGYRHIITACELFFRLRSTSAPVLEMMPLSLYDLFHSVRGVCLVVSALPITVLAYKRRYTETLCSLMLLGTSLVSLRFINLFLVFILPYWPWTLITIWKKHKIQTAVILLLGSVSFSSWHLVHADWCKKGFGIDRFALPVGAADFVLKHRLSETGRLFNSMNFGGYLMWRFQDQEKVFIDGRMELYTNDLLDTYSSIVNRPGAWRNLVQDHHISHAVVRYPKVYPQHGIWNDFSVLFPQATWALVYFDETALVYVQRDMVPWDFIQMFEYHWAKPYMLDFSYIQPSHRVDVIRELRRNLQESPSNYRSSYTLSYIETTLGCSHLSAAEKALRDALMRYPCFRKAKSILLDLQTKSCPK